VLEPFPDTESASRGAASRRILSSRTRYVLTRGFYLDPWAACKALVCRQVRCRIMSLRQSSNSPSTTRLRNSPTGAPTVPSLMVVNVGAGHP